MNKASRFFLSILTLGVFMISALASKAQANTGIEGKIKQAQAHNATKSPFVKTGYWSNYWDNWSNWNNWGNWPNWHNWGNFGNWGNF